MPAICALLFSPEKVGSAVQSRRGASHFPPTMLRMRRKKVKGKFLCVQRLLLGWITDTVCVVWVTRREKNRSQCSRGVCLFKKKSAATLKFLAFFLCWVVGQKRVRKYVYREQGPRHHHRHSRVSGCRLSPHFSVCCLSCSSCVCVLIYRCGKSCEKSVGLFPYFLLVTSSSSSNLNNRWW